MNHIIGPLSRPQPEPIHHYPADLGEAQWLGTVLYSAGKTDFTDKDIQDFANYINDQLDPKAIYDHETNKIKCPIAVWPEVEPIFARAVLEYPIDLD